MSQSRVDDGLVVDDAVDVQVDVEDGFDELLNEDIGDVDLTNFPHVVVHYQGGMYLTLVATHTGTSKNRS